MFDDQYRSQESEDDRKRQTDIVFAFSAALHLDALQIGCNRHYDAVFIRRQKPIALAEIKWRNHSFGRYATLTIDKFKLDNLALAAHRQNVAAWLVVSWQGDIRYANVSDCSSFDTSEQQRHDRDERPDIVYHVPIKNFLRGD